MIHYVLLEVSDVARSGAFYDAVLGPLAYRRQYEGDGGLGWGLTKASIYITAGTPQPGFGVVSLPAKSIPAVKAAFEAGLEHGGQPKGEPGTAPRQGPGTYAARLRDPDGYTIEIAVAN